MAYHLPITIPKESVLETLASYPIYIDLSTLPAGFWSGIAYTDGRDIRVKNGDGDDIPFDLVICNALTETGAIFVKVTLNTSTDTVVYIHFGDAGNDFVPVDDANGRNAVWADYERVFFFNPNDEYADHTGKGSPPTFIGPSGCYLPSQISGETNCHQGVTWDGTYYYTTSTNLIRKYDASWNLITENTNPLANLGGTIDHIGDLDCHNGILYIAVAKYTTVESNEAIALFDSSDLSYISHHDISAQHPGCSSLCLDTANGYIYVISYTQNTTIWKYALSDFSYIGTITLSSALTLIQGITLWNGHFYINCDTANSHRTVCVKLDGTVLYPIATMPSGESFWEGIGHTDTHLICLGSVNSGYGHVYVLNPMNLVGGGVDFYTAGGYGKALGIPYLTTYTIGISALLHNHTQTRNIINYGLDGSGDDAKRQGIGYGGTGGKIGLWNATDSWLYFNSGPTNEVVYRLNAVHNGTTWRKFYQDGVGVTDNTCAQKPTSDANCLWLAADDATFSNMFQGYIGFVYLRSGLLSDNWLTAEVTNLKTPTSFYSVGTISESVIGIGDANQSSAIADASGAHGIAGATSLTESPGISTADGYCLVSGSGSAQADIEQVAASGAHGVSAEASCTQVSTVATAQGTFETLGSHGVGQTTGSSGTAAGVGAHGVAGVVAAEEGLSVVAAEGNFVAPVVGVSAIIQFPAIVNAGGAHGVSGIASITRSVQIIAADGYCQVSGVGQATGTSAIVDALGYRGSLTIGVGHVIQTSGRMIAYGTYIDPLRSRAKRFFEPITGDDLRRQSLIWSKTAVDQNLRVVALKWLNEEINKAA